MRFTHYGNLQGSFVGTGGELFKKGWWLWLLALFVAAVVTSSVLGPVIDRFSPVQFGGWLSGLPLRMLAIVCGLTTPFWWAQFRTIMWRWKISAMRFGDVRLTSDIVARALLQRYMAVIGWSFVIVIVMIAVVSLGSFVLVASLGQTGLQAFMTSPAVTALGLVLYVPIILFINIIIRMNIVHDIWQLVAQSITISGLDAVQSLAVAGESANAMGEGLSDGLDIGGF